MVNPSSPTSTLSLRETATNTTQINTIDDSTSNRNPSHLIDIVVKTNKNYSINMLSIGLRGPETIVGTKQQCYDKV